MEISEGIHVTAQSEIFVDWYCSHCGQRHRIAEIKPRCSNCKTKPSLREVKGIEHGLSLGKRILERVTRPIDLPLNNDV